MIYSENCPHIIDRLQFRVLQKELLVSGKNSELASVASRDKRSTSGLSKSKAQWGLRIGGDDGDLKSMESEVRGPGLAPN